MLEYRDVAAVASTGTNTEARQSARESGKPRFSLSEQELNARIGQAVTAAKLELERQLRDECERKLEAERSRITQLIEEFHQERAEYYSKVEPELVQMILSVAGKILHREAQVDRMLVAALAKVAVENLQQRSHVVLRVAPEACAEWREFFAKHLTGTKVEILEDSQLEREGCLLETELGSADVGIEAQLKEIERGFFDLLAARPEMR
jgi:flagellar assembly protein FliH